MDKLKALFNSSFFCNSVQVVGMAIGLWVIIQQSKKQKSSNPYVSRR